MRNIEIKAKVNDPDTFLSKANRFPNMPLSELDQTDYFFNTTKPELRLKLRVERRSDLQNDPNKIRWDSNIRSYLVSYERPDETGPKLSKYDIYTPSDPEQLRRCLTTSLGLKGILRKNRKVWLNGNTRIHFDNVQNLGYFMELEVVLDSNETPKEGERKARFLMNELGVKEDDLIDCAYFDLLQKKE